MKISLIASALSMPIRQIPRAARQAGFDGLAFGIISPLIDLTQLSATGQRDFRHLLASENQQLSGIFIKVGAKGLLPGSDVDQALDQLDEAFRVARALGGVQVCVDLGPLPPVDQPASVRPKITDAMMGMLILPKTSENPTEAVPAARKANPASVDQVSRAMGSIAERVNRHGVFVAFQSELSGFASLLSAVSAPGCPWFGVQLDPVAVLKDDWTLDEVLSRAGVMVSHLRARDALSGNDRRTQPMPIGEGSTDWPALLAGLDACGFQGWATIDPLDLPDRAGGARTGLASLRSVSR